MSHVQRYLMEKDELVKYNATPIYNNDETLSNCQSTLAGTASNSNKSEGCYVGKKTHWNEKDDDEETLSEGPIVGICLYGWHITSNNSCIANQDEIHDITSTLMDRAKRKLWPPELLFYRAHVTISRIHPHLHYYNYHPTNTSISTTNVGQLSVVGAMLKLDALSALGEWASAHCNGTSEETGGMSILKTKDAPLWEFRQKKQLMTLQPYQQQPHHNPTYGTATTTTTSSRNTSPTMRNSSLLSSHIGELNFDWTYSTPFTGFFQTAAGTTTTTTDTTRTERWIPCEHSGIRMDLLTDRTQPILYFDDVTLYEDDLHDNGQVQLSIKLRVMPTCFYLLQRLFLRVDRVIVRCRDTRIFHLFVTTTSTTASASCSAHNSSSSTVPTTIPPTGVTCYRDVTWREAKWEDLSTLHLPNDVSSWRISSDGGTNTSQILLGKLPLVTLPPSIPPHSYVYLQ
jgi:type 2A phosphatase activator TIP41